MLDALALRLDAAHPRDAGPEILPLRTRGLVFEAGGERLLDGISLTLEEGTLTAIMGPNGAGKSLLLRVLHGLLRPSAGQVLWNGNPVSPEVVRRQGMVFQRPVLLRRSVAANVRYALATRGVPRAQRVERAAQVLGFADLEHLADRPARVLSGGEQQRLAMARALATEPDVLFLDEPTASLDPASTLSLEKLVARAQAVGTKIVLVTHDIGQARRLADEVIFLHKGRLLEQTSAERFFQSPSSEKARVFLAGRILL
jgi:tungstate transport system ATP-binding protein